jgi:broad specificity phosphatase PhoE
MNTFGLLRHGPTLWNLRKQLQGQEDIPLNLDAFKAEPWQQLLASYGPWDHIVCSSLNRCRTTCHLLFPGRTYEIDDDLREQHWGRWTGQTLKQITRQTPGSLEVQEGRGWDFTPPGGESRRQVLARVLKALDRAAAGRNKQRILLITHLGVIKILLNHLENTPFLPGQSSRVAKRALHLLHRDDGQLSILQTNIESQ